MDAVQLISGQGGWPLNAFALPDGRPFYAGTYFPKDNWMEVLQYFVDIKQEKPELLIQQAEKITEGLLGIEIQPFTPEEAPVSMEDLGDFFGNLQPHLDFEKGGMNRAPKFPMPVVWEYLLMYNHISGNEEALEAVKCTLDNMALGGIYDQVGGGFARYSTDMDWHVPHFEKMLYDNAQLVSLYSHAWQRTKEPLYREVVFETLAFIDRELTSPEGGFYSSLDADSEGVEGKFYTWSLDEVEELPGNDAALITAYFHITPEGNWEHNRNIPNRKIETEIKLLTKYNITAQQLQQKVYAAKQTLLEKRDQRIRPGLDDKILTSWNALMLRAYTDAYRVFGEKKFLEAALQNAGFLLSNVKRNDGGLYRNFKNGKASIQGFLDDYAFTISAFVSLYQATFDEQWLHKAKDLLNYVKQNFADPDSPLFFYKDNQFDQLIVRKKERSDNVIPSSNSEMALNLYRLGHYMDNPADIARAEDMALLMQAHIAGNIYYHANWGILAALILKKPYEIAITGEDCIKLRNDLDQHYLPDVLFLGTDKESKLALLKDKLIEGETTIYVCKDKTCRMPVKEVALALEMMR